MFRSSVTRVLIFLDDVLGDPATTATHPDRHLHPHRRPLRWQRERRAGTVAARPAHCVSPVRAAGPGERERAVR